MWYYKTKLHLGIERETDRIKNSTAVNAINGPAEKASHIPLSYGKTLSSNTHLNSPITDFIWRLLKCPPSWPLNQDARGRLVAIMKEKVTSSYDLLIGFGSFLTTDRQGYSGVRDQQ